MSLFFPKEWVNKEQASISMSLLKDIPLLLLHRIKGLGQYELILNECRRHGLSQISFVNARM